MRSVCVLVVSLVVLAHLGLGATFAPLPTRFIPLVSSSNALYLNPSKVDFFSSTPVKVRWPAFFSTRILDSTLTSSYSYSFVWSFNGVKTTTTNCGVEVSSGTLSTSALCNASVLHYAWKTPGYKSVNLTISARSSSSSGAFTPVLTIYKAVQIISGSLPDTSVVRSELHDVASNLTLWNRFVDAAHVLRTNGLYDYMVAIHVSSANQYSTSKQRSAAHLGPAFLPWHRIYLLSLERMLQVAANDTTLFVPYWDWTIDRAGGLTALNKIFNSNILGTAAAGSVSDGPFCSVTSSGTVLCPSSSRSPWIVRLNGPRLSRNVYTSNYASLPSSSIISNLMSITSYDTSPYDSVSDNSVLNSLFSFRVVLEGWSRPSNWSGTDSKLHNGVHVWIGGSMSQFTSPNDPIFYLHHGNIDRIWSIWEQKVCKSVNGSEAVSGGSWCYRPNKYSDITSSVPDAVCSGGICNLEGQMIDSTLFPFGYLTPRDVVGSNDAYSYAQSTGFN